MAQSASPCFSPSSLLLAGRVTGQSELINSPSLDPRSEEDFGHGASLSRESAPLVCCGLYAPQPSETGQTNDAFGCQTDLATRGMGVAEREQSLISGEIQVPVP